MTDPKPNLIAKYLAGDADADEVRQLNQALGDDPMAADKLMSEAYFDVRLREALKGSAAGAPITEIPTSNPAGMQWLSSSWMTAAMLLVAVSGWAVTAYVAGELGDARTNISALKNRVTELEAASTPPPIEDAKSDAPEIHSMRGWLMELPQKGESNIINETLLVGTTAPLDKRLLTCPWGAAEFRYGNGVSISAERNTTFNFNQTDGLRRLTLERGILHVTNMSKTDHSPTEIKSALATVRLIHGQVAVQVDKHGTAVEAAVHQAKVQTKVAGVNKTFIVKRGQYLIIRPGKEPRVVPGMLKMGLEPPNG